ncbi:MAG: thioredoxin family protein [Mycobacterium leprae]
MVSVKLLGAVCCRNARFAANVKQALTELGVEFTVENVRDRAAILAYGVIRTPGLVVNERLLVSGRTLTVEELKTMIAGVLP